MGKIFLKTFLKQLKMKVFGICATYTPRLRVGCLVRSISVAEELGREGYGPNFVGMVNAYSNGERMYLI